LDPSGIFPGGKVRCPCGTDNAVVKAPVLSPYRVPADATEAAATATKTQDAGDSICPRCQNPLGASQTEGARPSLACPACGGMFLDHDTFRAEVGDAIGKHKGASVPAKAPRQSARETSVRYIKCPHCQQIMNRMNFGKTSGIMLDACKAHGTWFDRDELGDVLAAAEHGAIAADLAKLGTLPAPKAPATEADKMLAMAAVSLEVDRARTERRVDQVVTTLTVVDDLLWLLVRG
jgi:Zn-finger nucleic acid-binding protein